MKPTKTKIVPQNLPSETSDTYPPRREANPKPTAPHSLWLP